MIVSETNGSPMSGWTPRSPRSATAAGRSNLDLGRVRGRGSGPDVEQNQGVVRALAGPNPDGGQLRIVDLKRGVELVDAVVDQQAEVDRNG